MGLQDSTKLPRGFKEETTGRSHSEALCPSPVEGRQPPSLRDGQLFPGAQQFWLAPALLTGCWPGFGELELKSTGPGLQKRVSGLLPAFPALVCSEEQEGEESLQEKSKAEWPARPTLSGGSPD